jgi:beta-glucosidase
MTSPRDHRFTFVAVATAGVLVGCSAADHDVGASSADAGKRVVDATTSDHASPHAQADASDADLRRTDADAGASLADGSTDASVASLDTPAVEGTVAALLAQMTLAEKAAQMVMVDYTGAGGVVPPDDIATYALGALLAAGGDAPGNDQPSDWLALTSQYVAQGAMSRLKIPIFFGIDAVHGNAKVEGATVFPHGIGMGSTRDAKLVQAEEHVTASELAAMGINLSFSPDSDVGQDERWGRTYESFGEEPTLVSTMVAAAVTGYQEPHLGAPGTVVACPKHVLGAGGTAWGTGVKGGIDQGDTEITEAEMRAVHLPPFQAAIQAGAMSMMVSYSSWNGTKMSASTEWLTSVIKGELGYTGFLLSDYNAVPQLAGTTQEQEATAINAGLDMIMMSTGYAQFIDDIVSLVPATIPQSRIDDAVTRILRAKVIAGLFTATSPDPGALAAVGSAAHRQVARQAVNESIVLLQNENDILPLSKSAHIHLAGAASDLGVQSGGWTLGWQGVTTLSTPRSSAGILGGTTIEAGLQNAASSTGLVTYDFFGAGVPSGTDIGVVVLYENPYAEYMGDTDDPSLSNTAPSQNPSGNTIYTTNTPEIMSNMQAAHIPLVLLILSGRPIRIQSYLSQFDAVVAAWLPGSEGEGIADVLYGDVKFTGTLPKSWPMDSTVLPISSLESGIDPLFAFGFGLTYP